MWRGVGAVKAASDACPFEGEAVFFGGSWVIMRKVAWM